MATLRKIRSLAAHNREKCCHSRSALHTSRNTNGINQGTNEYDYQSDPHPKIRDSPSQNAQNFGPDAAYDMVTAVREEITYCSPVLVKHKKTPSASEPQFHTKHPCDNRSRRKFLGPSAVTKQLPFCYF